MRANDKKNLKILNDSYMAVIFSIVSAGFFDENVER